MAFDCRKCPDEIRERCIEQANTSPSVKKMMRMAFEVGTDTQWMWGLLQMNCLIAPQALPQESTPRHASLSRRLHGVPRPPTGEVTTVPGEEVAPVREETPVPPAPPAPLAAPRPARPPPARPAEVEVTVAEPTRVRYSLTSRRSHRRIALPAQGEIVLGRFDPETDVTPDVDLSYEDRDYHFISRRHARIVGHGGWHEIEDLGSTNGTTVNWRRLNLGQRQRLQPGDQVTLGSCEFIYNPIPEVRASGSAPLPAACLWSTFTGHRFDLPMSGEVIIGRSDPEVSLQPDLDLREEGDAARVVSRRHAKIIAHNGRHFLEDLGSATGTKLNGLPLRIGEISQLNVGDHLWLGGFVLAYDVELRPSKTTTEKRVQ